MAGHEIFWLPFYEYQFLRRALIGCLALSLSCGPIGVFLVLRRMSLMGDALAHSLLPGVAAGFFLYGLSPVAMALGGLIAGLGVAAAAGFAARHTILQEETTFAGFYLIAMASGVLILSLRGNQLDLMHVLLGTVLSISSTSLVGLATVSTFTLGALAFLYRSLLLECLDPLFFRSVGGKGGWIHGGFIFLVTLNLVAAFQALGTLMALGLMILPAICAQLWCRQLWIVCILSIILSSMASYLGILFSFYFSLPCGPAIVLIAGLFYLLLLVWVSLQKILRHRVVFVFFILVFGSPGFAHASPLNVVASFSILGNFIETIAQDKAIVSVLVGPNGDAHVYEPKPKDLQLLQRADVVFINGLGFERWMDRLIRASGFNGPVVDCSQGVQPRWVMAGPHKIQDPHAWHAVDNALFYIENIQRALTACAPQWADFFALQARAYKTQLIDLDRWVKQQLELIPPCRRILLTAHDAFGYFGERYGVQLLAPMGLSTEGEPSAKVIADLIVKGRERRVRTVFFENITNPALMRQVAQDGKMRLGGTLYSDALSGKDSPGATYLKMIRHNVKTFVAGMR